jgi:hypothetical protein
MWGLDWTLTILSHTSQSSDIANSHSLLFIYFLTQVRLLTGVGRYTEMNYIFQILKDNEQFESLLGKGLVKVHTSVDTSVLSVINKFTFTVLQYTFLAVSSGGYMPPSVVP